MVTKIKRKTGRRAVRRLGSPTGYASSAFGPGSGRSSRNSKKNRKVWYSIFGPEYWQPADDGGNGGTGYWDGSKWVANEYLSSGLYQVLLEPKGDWEVDFRPQRIRVKQSTHTANASLRDGDSPRNNIMIVASPQEIYEAVLEFAGSGDPKYDLAQLFEQKTGSGFNITDILFRSDVAPTVPTTTTTTTTVTTTTV